MVTVAYKIIFLADVMFTVDWRAALLYRLTPFGRVGDPSAVNTLGMICGLNGVCSLPPPLPHSAWLWDPITRETNSEAEEGKQIFKAEAFVHSITLTSFLHRFQSLEGVKLSG